jgi:catechol 2,3-dioxygenase-like lactoylglutathione lyase family enzyme
MVTIDHVTIRAGDLDVSLALFARAFELLEFKGERSDGAGFHEWNDFSITGPDSEHPPTRNLHIGLAATSRDQVDEWWNALTAAGYRDDGPPGPRPEFGSTYYGAFIRDADDNSIEAVHHESATPDTGVIDHLWIRVSDLEATMRFYGSIAEAMGIYARDRVDRLQLIADSGTFSVLEGPPTENLHLALGVSDEDSVRLFHKAALEGGGRDNGKPGERPQYHAGYYAAFALDPDSNNIEAVFHNRP